MKSTIHFAGDMLGLEKEETGRIESFKIPIVHMFLEPLDVDYYANDNVVEVKINMNNGDKIYYFFNNRECYISINGESTTLSADTIGDPTMVIIRQYYVRHVLKKLVKLPV